MINFYTDRMVIVCYPGGAGGKFLINSLGLSTGAVFQRIGFAVSQINNGINTKYKSKYLHYQLDAVTDHWNDLNLGCGQLFGANNVDYLTGQELQFDPRIEDVINSGKYIFLVAHDISFLKAYLKIWKNPKIIMFKNTRNFIESRGNFRFTGLSEPTPRQIDYSINSFEFEVNRFTATTNPIWWDTNWFFSRSDTMTNIQKLYNTLGLTDFDEGYIGPYYDAWISKLEQLKHK